MTSVAAIPPLPHADRGAAPTVIELRDCPLCHHRDLTRLPVPGRWIGKSIFAPLRGEIGLCRCRGCRLVFTNPRPSDELLGRFYSGDTYECHDTAGSASAGRKADLILEILERAIDPALPRSLLDYGAGGGGFALRARERGWRIAAYEPGRRGADRCRSAGIETARTLEDLGDQRFSILTLHHVAEHLTDPIAALARARDFALPGGALFVEVPNAGSLRARLALPALSRMGPVDERYRAFPIHLAYYTARTLRATLAAAGWFVDRVLTLGLGIDEFLVKHPAAQRSAATAGAALRRSGLKHRLRDAFLGAGLGENLAAIARVEGR